MVAFLVALVLAWTGYFLSGAVLFNPPEDQPRTLGPMMVAGPVALIACAAVVVVGFFRLPWWQPLAGAFIAMTIGGMVRQALRRSPVLPGIALLMIAAGVSSAVYWLMRG